MPVVDSGDPTKNDDRLEQADDALDRSNGDLVTKLLAREQAFRALADDRRSRLARISAVEAEKKALSTRLQAAEAALRFRDEADRTRRIRILPLGIQLLWVRLTNRIPSSRRRRFRLANDIRATGLFDEAYYLVQNPFVRRIGLDPAVHFATVGWKMDRRPNPFFAPLFYASQAVGGLAAGEHPLVHFANSGWKQGMRPSPEFDAAKYLEVWPDLIEADVNPLLHYIENGCPALPDRSLAESPASEEANSSIPETLAKRRGAWTSLRVYQDEKGERTITVILDNVVGGLVSDPSTTAIVVGCIVAKRLAARLRIATRGVSMCPSIFNQVLIANNVDFSDNVSFVPISAAAGRPLAITRDDRMLTTSWASTRAALGALPPEQVLYLVQEDERAGCACGDDRLLCQETLLHPGLDILVQSRALFDTLAARDQTGILRARGQFFDLVASKVCAQTVHEERRPMNFVFYADARDRRNLYRRGLEVIHAAMCDGTLSPQHWKFHFVGRHLDNVVLPDGLSPTFCDSSHWDAYSGLIASMDLGLCLDEAAAPSPLVLDLASAGAVVVVNAAQCDDASLSKNILPTSLDVSAICKTLQRGAALADDLKTRVMNREADKICRAWATELIPALDRLRIGTR